MSEKYIYLDHAATTPPAPEVIQVLNDFLVENYANANSLHSKGQQAMRVIEQSRATVAQLLGAKSTEVFFTSGATESNNWVLQGLYQQLAGQSMHFVISSFEHPAVKEVASKFLSKQVDVEITYVDPDSEGLISVEKVQAAIKENTVLVSIMYANNEIGTVQPLAEIGAILEEMNKERNQKILFHTDATQAPLYLNMNVNDLKVDFLTMSAHKIYGPKGVGALFVREGLKIKPLFWGGHQEKEKRSGTYNVPGIAAFAKAVELILNNKEEDIAHALELKELLMFQLAEKIDKYTINGSVEKRLPNNLNINIPQAEGEAILFWLDEAGIAVSTGSACAAGDLGMSPVLSAIGVKPEDGHGSVRVTWGRGTTKEDIIYFVDKLKETVDKLREMSPLK